MPSPRTVLADIHDLNLDPKVAHTGIKASGHLRKGPVVELVAESVVEPVAELKVAEPKDMKPDPVSLPEAEPEPVKDVEIEVTPEMPAETPPPAPVELPKKKGSPFKKKDKPEVPPAAGS